MEALKTAKYQLKPGKRGLLRTLEVFFAIVISFIFLIYVMPYQTFKQEEKPLMAPYLIDDCKLREAASSGNMTEINERINQRMDVLYPNYKFNVSISNNPNYFLNLNHKEVRSESFFIIGNVTNKKDYIVRIYYWKRGE